MENVYLLRCHVTRIRHLLQAGSSEKRKNGPASLGCPAAGALGLPGAVHGLAGGVLCVDLSKTEWLFMRYRRLFLLGLQFKETLAIVACR